MTLGGGGGGHVQEIMKENRDHLSVDKNSSANGLYTVFNLMLSL